MNTILPAPAAPQRADDPIRSYADVDRFLQYLVRADPRPYAARACYAQQAIGQLLRRMGDPHCGLRIVHIAGSKGKGSTALMTEAILRAAGFRVGTFTSPHLMRWNERYRINGHDIDNARLVTLMEALRPHIAMLAAENPDNPPSFFDVLTGAGLLLFQQEKVDYAIVEVGLGGRLDATNIVVPAVTCITSIELEHTDKLGNTLEAIAAEKAGIIKPGIPLVFGMLPDAAARVVDRRATSLGAPTIRPTTISHLRLPIAVEHQAQNAALALACIRQLDTMDETALHRAAQQGFSDLRLPGRSEILARHPWVVVDAAHTPASARALAKFLAGLPAQRIHLLISITAGKDPLAICEPLLVLAAKVAITRADPQRSMEPAQVAAILRNCRPGPTIDVIDDPLLATESVYKTLLPNDLLCVAGSVYIAGIARTALVERINK